MKAKDIKYVFEQNPELKEIGSKIQYFKYLKTVFPESKVKDIVYQGGRVFEGNMKTEKGIYFTKSREYAKEFLSINKDATLLHSAILNLKEPTEINFFNYEIIDILNNVRKDKKLDLGKYSKKIRAFAEELLGDKGLIKQIKESDSFVGQDLYDDEHKPNIFSYGGSPDYFYKLKNLAENTQNYVAFEPEQIHILGSKKDIGGFNEFVSKNQGNSSLEKRSVSGFFIFSFLVGLIFSTNSITGNVIGTIPGNFNFIWPALSFVGLLGFYLNAKYKK